MSDTVPEELRGFDLDQFMKSFLKVTLEQMTMMYEIIIKAFDLFIYGRTHMFPQTGTYKMLLHQQLLR